MKDYKEFIYLPKEDYDKTVKINGEELGVYSEKKMRDLYPAEDYTVVGETYEDKKRDKKKDIGRIELNEKRLYVVEDGAHNSLFKKQGAFVEVKDGGYIALVKTRLLPFIILFGLLLGIVAGGVYGYLSSRPAVADPEKDDPYIKPIETDLVTVSGTVYYGETAVQDAEVVLLQGDTVLFSTTTDENGKYLFGKVADGYYNLTATYRNSTSTKAVGVNKKAVVQDFYLTDDDLTVNVRKADENTPDVVVGGLDGAAKKYAVDGKRVNVTFTATKLAEEAAPTTDVTQIKLLSGDTKLTLFDFSILAETFNLAGVKEREDGIYETDEPLEIIIPYDSTRDVGTYVFRSHNGDGLKFTELNARPNGNYADGTYYVAANYVFIYAKYFSTYAIGSASAGKVTKGSDTITYSDKAYVNLKTGEIEMLYRHGTDSSNDARVELYLVGENKDLLIARSGRIPTGHELGKMMLLDNLTGLPSVGTYAGYMRISYLDTEGNSAAKVDIPLSVAIYR